MPFFINPIHRGSHGERGLSFMVVVALIFVSTIIAALIGILASTVRTSAQQYRSYTNEALCRNILLDVVEPVLEDEGWPRMPIHSWMEPCETPESCFNRANKVMRNHKKYRLIAIPTPENTYIITVFDTNGHIICDTVHLKPAPANFLEPSP